MKGRPIMKCPSSLLSLNSVLCILFGLFVIYDKHIVVAGVKKIVNPNSYLPTVSIKSGSSSSFVTRRRKHPAFLRKIYKLQHQQPLSQPEKLSAHLNGGYSSNISCQPQFWCIRQVPGDGSCLFYAVAAWVRHILRNTKHNMSTNGLIANATELSRTVDSTPDGSSNDNDNDNNDDEDDDDDDDLACMAAQLRNMSVNVLQQHQQEMMCDPNYFQRQQHAQQTEQEFQAAAATTTTTTTATTSTCASYTLPALLHVENGEVVESSHLLNLIAEHYNTTARQYLQSMLHPSTWGGGPEIVAMSNCLQCPINVYELVNYTSSGEICSGDSTACAGAGCSSSGSSNRELPWIKNSYCRCQILSRECATAATAGPFDIVDRNFKLKLCASFGNVFSNTSSPLHILCVDGRFPNIKPGQQKINGDHFMPIFPCCAGTQAGRRSEDRYRYSTSGRRVGDTDTLEDDQLLSICGNPDNCSDRDMLFYSYNASVISHWKNIALHGSNVVLTGRYKAIDDGNKEKHEGNENDAASSVFSTIRQQKVSGTTKGTSPQRVTHDSSNSSSSSSSRGNSNSNSNSRYKRKRWVSWPWLGKKKWITFFSTASNKQR